MYLFYILQTWHARCNSLCCQYFQTGKTFLNPVIVAYLSSTPNIEYNKSTMTELIPRLVERVTSSGYLPEIPATDELPIPSINKVELYLSFHGNDTCLHCITSSGPHRNELLHPRSAEIAIRHIADYSVLNTLNKVCSGGTPRFFQSSELKRFDAEPAPPESLHDELIVDYANAIMGKGCSGEWYHASGSFPLNFGRPSIRLSGGEFYTWPHQLNGRKVDEAERLAYQKQLLATIRSHLPEYDIWILTNGRFAESDEKADQVISRWADDGRHGAPERGQTRIVVSVDPFHRPPKGSTVEAMLDRLWRSSFAHLNRAPYIYSITNKKLFLVGRALKHFKCGSLTRHEIKNVSCSSMVNGDRLITDPNNLCASDGCEELKGFVCRTPAGGLLVNNIVISDKGNLAYCCVGVGDYGDFIQHPRKALVQMLKDPISRMLRNGRSAEKLLNLAVELDPSIKVFGESSQERAAGSTCYQLLSGARVKNQSHVGVHVDAVS